ncbi:MAG: rhomboid family intramembrane serine protease [Bacteroidia bacterium]|jgi:rhomboid protease GluP|nr:rhomboid family intramembrane serine protease [Bacteroidia bacterium]
MTNYFIPRGNYFFTPLLIYANVAVWLMMVISGAPVFHPDAAEVMNWGGNRAALTFDGDVWRLFTSMFVHRGLVYLALTLIALATMSIWLENQIGRWRFAVIYFFAGIISSAAASWYQPLTDVVAGASGACFGIAGAILAVWMVKKNSPPRTASFLAFATLFLGYSIYTGISDKGNNALNVSGLLAGLILGIIAVYDFRTPVRTYRFTTLAALAGLAISTTFFFLAAKPVQQRATAIQMMNDFAELDQATADAQEFFDRQAETGDSVNAEDYRQKVVLQRKKLLEMSEQMKQLEMTEDEKFLLTKFNEYASLRAEQATDYHQYLKTEKVHFLKRSANLGEQADELINAINQAYENQAKKEK